MDWQRADQIITTHLGSLLVVVLVAVSAFILGSQYQNTSATTVAEGEGTEKSGVKSTGSSTIQELQQLIANPASQTTAVGSESTQQPLAGLVSINTGSQAQLETLPGIGPSKAKAIIDYRLKNGPFVRVEDLDKVSGIGPKTLESLRPLVTL